MGPIVQPVMGPSPLVQPGCTPVAHDVTHAVGRGAQPTITPVALGPTQVPSSPLAVGIVVVAETGRARWSVTALDGALLTNPYP
ncbi:MAG: hypothetical protein ACREMY_01185 [bacterium]